MKRSLFIALFSSLFLFGLLWVPLDEKMDNTFVFFLGRFHPLILHLPIGTLVVLFLMEFSNTLFPKLNLETACKMLLWFSVITILPTTLLGFLLGSSGSYDDELLNTHKWLGWFTALVCIWLVVIRGLKRTNAIDVSRFYKLFLSVNVILLTLAGHYGSYLTHGEDFLIKYMPMGMKHFLNIEDEADYLVLNNDVETNSEEALYYEGRITQSQHDRWTNVF